jgi:outer membrane immunogenic protein
MAPVALYNWSGFYVGAHVGGFWSDKDFNETCSSVVAGGPCLAPGAPGGPALPIGQASNGPSGFLAGAQAGFNFQTGNIVWGIEGQWSWTDDSNDCGGVRFGGAAGIGSMCTSINWLATIAGRVGVTWDRALIYVKGGIAFVDEEHQIFPVAGGAAFTNSVGDTRTGWMVGVGLEYALWDNWSAKIEYNYMDFGSQNYTFTGGAGFGCAGAACVTSMDVDQVVQVVKVGINYRFGWAGPVVAKY